MISSAIIVILKELELAVEPALGTMLKMQWGNLGTVSGQSPYVADFVKAVDSVVEGVRDHIEQKKYLRNFYDKAATYVFLFLFSDQDLRTHAAAIVLSRVLITRFTNALVRSRPLKEIGAEQVCSERLGLRR